MRCSDLTHLRMALLCPLCAQPFEQPTILWPCGHTYCRLCVFKMHQADDSIKCYQCWNEHANKASGHRFGEHQLVDVVSFMMCGVCEETDTR